MKDYEIQLIDGEFIAVRFLCKITEVKNILHEIEKDYDKATGKPKDHFRGAAEMVKEDE